MEKIQVEPKSVFTTRLVKSEDLNHHGTLFAGRTAEWFVESGFIAAASLVNPTGVVCLKIHGMFFTKPVRPGQIIKFESKIVYAGKSSLVANIQVTQSGVEKPFVDGFITFIHVNEHTVPSAHNIEITPKTEADIALYEQAKALKVKG
ncbi:acyl-CoA thioesterase [Alistipes sp. ZOR0009]|jgi:acyl-CoA hydrolase|uniref:acyl-CoA thioesterase n=1 Tax=Alistipes sp. ZOR0009 TaxID=1339253 RepID=UPI000648FDB5|nr:hotdog domain-containing protein [Alistipes sp. ZOR0009]